MITKNSVDWPVSRNLFLAVTKKWINPIDLLPSIKHEIIRASFVIPVSCCLMQDLSDDELLIHEWLISS
jgi:hypothetical protein